MGPQESGAGVDVLASGIHDAKNRLFEAQILLDQAEQATPLSLADARVAITGAATRLSRTLVAYRLLRDQQPMSIMPVSVLQLLEDVQLTVRTQYERAGRSLNVAAAYHGEWPLDRTLVADVLVNALQNACRYAQSEVRLEVMRANGHLRMLVNDDGPGYPEVGREALPEGRSGLGLFISRQIAGLHRRKGAYGCLSLENGGPLGGALFDLSIP